MRRLCGPLLLATGVLDLLYGFSQDLPSDVHHAVRSRPPQYTVSLASALGCHKVPLPSAPRLDGSTRAGH